MAKSNIAEKETIEAPQRNQVVQIAAPKLRVVQLKLIGTSPYVQLRFSEKNMNMMMEKMEAGPQSKGKRVRKVRDFNDDYEAAKHVSRQGWVGVPAGSFRNAMISACRLVGFKMTLAKLSLFILADGYDRIDGVPLVRIHGEPHPNTMPVRNATGVADVRCRPMWDEWHINLRIQFDQDQFSVTDVSNLVSRVGSQVGIGEGRYDSRESCGLGWGCFRLAEGATDGHENVEPIAKKRGPKPRLHVIEAPVEQPFPKKRGRKSNAQKEAERLAAEGTAAKGTRPRFRAE